MSQQGRRPPRLALPTAGLGSSRVRPRPDGCATSWAAEDTSTVSMLLDGFTCDRAPGQVDLHRVGERWSDHLGREFKVEARHRLGSWVTVTLAANLLSQVLCGIGSHDGQGNLLALLVLSVEVGSKAGQSCSCRTCGDEDSFDMRIILSDLSENDCQVILGERELVWIRAWRRCVARLGRAKDVILVNGAELPEKIAYGGGNVIEATAGGRWSGPAEADRKVSSKPMRCHPGPLRPMEVIVRLRRAPVLTRLL